MPFKQKTMKRPFIQREIDSEPKGSHESTRKRLEGTLPKEHEDHIAEKVFNSRMAADESQKQK